MATLTGPSSCAAGAASVKVTLRGDTDFTQTKHLDRWDADGVRFVFGIDARQNCLKDWAEDLPAWGVQRAEASGLGIRSRPHLGVAHRKDHKTPIVVARQYETIRLKGEEVAEFEYRPVACKQGLSGHRAPQTICREGRVNRFSSRSTVTSFTSPMTARPRRRRWCFLANDRCDQENLIAQLKAARGDGDAGE